MNTLTQVTVMYWNIWLDNQINGPQAAMPLLQELTKIIETHHPDCIGLNEVLMHRDATSPFIFEHLEKLGYKYNHYAASSPFTDEWIIGSGLVSKSKLQTVKEIELSKDIPAERRGYGNKTVKAMSAEVTLPNNQYFNVIVAHPLHMRLQTRQAHFEATRKLQQIMDEEAFATRTILGGDFNESIRWPGSFHKATQDRLNLKTGTLLKPTWLLNAKPWSPLRINLDQLYWNKDGSLVIKSFQVIKSKLSDHRPLLAVFEVV